jgi:predicted DNA-binding transcriptional regulator AlpA
MHPKQYWDQRDASLYGRKLRAPEAARYLGVSQSTLAKWRLYGTGPLFCKLGGVVVYDVADLNEFTDSRRRLSTSEYR